MALVLVVEDDVAIRTALVRGLSERGHAACSSGTGMDALTSVLSERPDLVVLDLGLPDVDGQEVLQMIRAVSAVPVVVATARDDDRAAVAALDAGADDYLVKPFTLEQLEARIRAVLRRSRPGEGPAPVVVGDLLVDPAAREVRLAGDQLALSAKEFDLLLYLAVRAGQVVSKQELLVEVWRRPYGGADKTVDVHLSWLRRKLGEPAGAPRYLHTVRGVGVKLTAV